jgi:hypothetical protein
MDNINANESNEIKYRVEIFNILRKTIENNDDENNFLSNLFIDEEIDNEKLLEMLIALI